MFSNYNILESYEDKNLQRTALIPEFDLAFSFGLIQHRPLKTAHKEQNHTTVSQISEMYSSYKMENVPANLAVEALAQFKSFKDDNSSRLWFTACCTLPMFSSIRVSFVVYIFSFNAVTYDATTRLRCEKGPFLACNHSQFCFASFSNNFIKRLRKR